MTESWALWQQKTRIHWGRRRAVIEAEGGLFSDRISGVTVAKGFQGTKCWVSCRKKARCSGVTAAAGGGCQGDGRKWRHVVVGWTKSLCLSWNIYILYIHKRRVLPMPSSVILEQPERERTVRFGSEWTGNIHILVSGTTSRKWDLITHLNYMQPPVPAGCGYMCRNLG
jgi:hypothetical protein